MRDFREVIDECELVDLPLRGYGFTWERGRGTDGFVEERLDRCLGTMNWIDMFPDVNLLCLFSSTSDHKPIETSTDLAVMHTRSGRFRFENLWLKETEFAAVVRQNYNDLADLDFIEKLRRGTDVMSKWGRDFKMQFKTEIVRVKADLTKTMMNRDE
ncbi:hypothetical protein DITRI_Ditri02bG0095800 [Diplodiscus trichospermus]